ncbi:hypothetical protein [Herbiconiux sp. UC225_62]|uniref:hypothetical protein n=1 Tax=Herbiconiux sp. UC225_62 TaxID=3350168 RepID=UPI0036D3FE2D
MPSRWITRTVAAVAVAAVVGTGTVALAPAAPAHASWQGSAQTWISTMNSAVGKAGKLFGIDTGGFDLAASIAGPLISAIFGDGGKGPGIKDVLDKLQELDDIEHRIDEMQSTLADIEQEVLAVNQNVLMGTCVNQTAGIFPYISKVKTSQAAYGDVLDQIEKMSKGATGADEAKELGNLVNAFIANTLGSESQKSVTTSAMASDIRTVHEAMISTQGRNGVIQSCGTAYFDAWKLTQASAGARQSASPTSQGVWLDDRQYYEPLQNIVQYWQTAQSQGMFLLQQASLMQAAKLYTAEKGTISPDQNAAVCSLAISQKAGDAKTICDTGLRFSKTFYDNVVEEWKQVGLPISDDKVVLSLGTDITGVRNGNDAIGSAVWARNPRSFPVDWAGGTWQTVATATTADGIAGFVPANSTRWKDLEAAYRTSHTSVTPAVQTPVQLFRDGSQPWAAAGVAPFAPLDILSTLRDNSPGGEARNFDTTGVSTVWMPGETTTRDIPAFRFATHSEEGDYHTYGNTSGLSFAPTTVFEHRLNPSWVNETGLTVKCMVVPVDGALCDGERIASWFIAHQKTDWSGTDKVFSVTPSSSAVGSFEAQTRTPNYCSTFFDGDERLNDACDWGFSIGVTELPSWLAYLGLKDGSSYDPAPSNQTLWPVAPVPAECGTTLWGVPTRCGASMDAWIKANIPNPSVSGPAANALPRIDGVYTVDCVGYNWVDRTDEAGVEVVTGDVSWSGVLPDGRAFTTTVAKGTRLDLTDFVRKAGWYDAAPPLFSLRCSFDAHYADSATTSTVTSRPADVKREDGRYVLRDASLEEPPVDPAPGAPVDGTDAAGSGSATLAATGSAGALWFGGAALVLLAGAALALVSRHRRRAS